VKKIILIPTPKSSQKQVREVCQDWKKKAEMCQECVRIKKKPVKI